MSPENMNALFDTMGSRAATRRQAWLTIIASQKYLLQQKISTNLTVKINNAPVTNTIATLAESSSVSLSGSGPQAHTAMILVNGLPAAWSTRTGAWSLTNPLTLTGRLNSVVVRALDSKGQCLRSNELWLVMGLFPVTCGGTITGAAVWSNPTGIMKVTSNVTVGASASLLITSNTLVWFNPGRASSFKTAVGLKFRGWPRPQLRCWGRVLTPPGASRPAARAPSSS